MYSTSRLYNACARNAALRWMPCVVASMAAIRARREWRSLFAPLLAPLGVGIFFSYLWIHAGSPFEWFFAQRAGWQSGSFGGGVPGAVETVIRHGIANPNATVKTLSLLVALGLLVLYFKAHPPAPWTGYVLAVLCLGMLSPVVGVTPRLLLRNFPLLGVVGARLPAFWFEIFLGFSTFCLATLAVLAMGSGRWTP